MATPHGSQEPLLRDVEGQWKARNGATMCGKGLIFGGAEDRGHIWVAQRPDPGKRVYAPLLEAVWPGGSDLTSLCFDVSSENRGWKWL